MRGPKDPTRRGRARGAGGRKRAQRSGKRAPSVRRDAPAGGEAGPAAAEDTAVPAPDGAATSEELTLRQAQRRIDEWISQFEEGYWPPLSNLARLMEEVGELARELNHRHGHKPKKRDEPEAELALELADILFVLLTLANEQEIDMQDAFARVLDKYRVRDAERWTRRQRQ